MSTKLYRPGATEAQVSAQVVEAARSFGIELERRNTGFGRDSSGRGIRFGTPGDSDWRATVPSGPNRGRELEVEVKREGFRPPRPGTKARAHFDRQLARMATTNAKCGLAFWVSGGLDALRVFRTIMTVPGLSVVFEGDYPFLVNEEDRP